MNKYVFHVSKKTVRKIEVLETDMNRAKEAAVDRFKEIDAAEEEKDPVITVLCTYFGPASAKELAEEEKTG